MFGLLNRREQDIRQDIARGAKLLDEKCSGWAPRIDREQLSVFSIYYCPVIQLYGSWEHGVRELGIFGSSQPYGFCGNNRHERFYRRAWLREIESRLRSAVPVAS